MAIQRISYMTNEKNYSLVTPIISFVERKQYKDQDSLYDPTKMIYEDTSYLRMSPFKNLGSFAENTTSYIKGLFEWKYLSQIKLLILYFLLI